MIRKPFKEMQLSMLGMGNMRLPTTEPRGPIDGEKAAAIIEHAYRSGINYFDTAYRYHGGASEPLVGRVLSQFPRDTWHLATKFPGHMMQVVDGKIQLVGYLAGERIESVAQIFEDQLQRCGVDYFDFYLLHNVCETSFDFYTNEALGVVDYLVEQKKAGRIRHLGFSAHGRADTIDKFLNWRNDFEFVQLQLNYLDWKLQDAARKYEVVTRHGLPVVVMEPVRGGRLADLKDAERAILAESGSDATPAAWAFRYLQGLPNVLVVLSGMTTMAQLEENLQIFDAMQPLNAQEQALLARVTERMTEMVPCTGCEYCLEHCPQGLNIPKLLSMYNEIRFENPNTLRFTLDAMSPDELPGACIGCGACSTQCPQGIDIPDVMRKFDALLKQQA